MHFLGTLGIRKKNKYTRIRVRNNTTGTVDYVYDSQYYGLAFYCYEPVYIIEDLS